ncbi:MAG: SRPBCC family protein [Tepidisphaeraceae bacterium]
MIAAMSDEQRYDELRNMPRRCLGCGYVIDHLGESGDCPECGRHYNVHDPATFSRKPPFVRWTLWMPGLLTAVGVGAALSFSLIPFVGYGAAVTIAIPVSVGAILGYRVHVGVAMLMLLAFIAVASIVVMLLAADVTGGMCTFILGLLALLPAFAGALVGKMLRHQLKQTNFSQRWHLPILGLLPVMIALAEDRHTNMPVVSTSTMATINLPPERVWKAIQFYEQVKHRPPLLLWVTPSLRPRYTTGSSEHVGDRKICVYEKGRLVKEITEVEPGKSLAFRVVEQTDIENDGIRLIDGSFELVPTADGRGTVVKLTTRYEPKLAPRFAYLPAENWAVHTLHGHVLRGMKEDAEARP